MTGDVTGSTAGDTASDSAGAPTCSARGCRAAPAFELRWNNPRLHTPERRKVWLACTAHRDHLSEFLSARGFLREVVALRGTDR